MYLLDTDICSYIMKRHPENVYKYLQKIPMEHLHVSVMSVAELRYGVERLESARFTQGEVDKFIQYLNVLSWENTATLEYAKIRHYLTKKGKLIGHMDMLIAAHALSLNMILVTNNEKHFKVVPNLKIENWTRKE